MSAIPAEVAPRTLEESRALPPNPDVVARAQARGIDRVVHFTPMLGLVGVLATGALKSRLLLPEEKYLEYAYNPNCIYRRDEPWSGYVNMSIMRVNDWMLDTSRRWHPQKEWAILGFDVEILGDPGVVFTPTNNAHTAEHHEGLAGFERMFACGLGGWKAVPDRNDVPDFHTTDRQAEVLYPGEVSVTMLRVVTVANDNDADTVAGMRFEDMDFNIEIDHEAFQ